ncbi:hypothetical protein STA3757_01190 [Stanieria sp. NIES-3757]|nr:hypothetical protein STA3757_01190 [Stanieria sp. NIES-3757]
MSNHHSMGFINRIITTFMLVVVLIACERMPDNKTSNNQPSNQIQVQQ